MTMQYRPTLSAEEMAALNGHEATIATAQSVLNDLAAIGVDTSAHQALLDQTEQVRRGLLDRFSSTTPVPTRAPRARR